MCEHGLDSTGSGQDAVVGSCKYGNKPLGSMKDDRATVSLSRWTRFHIPELCENFRLMQDTKSGSPERSLHVLWITWTAGWITGIIRKAKKYSVLLYKSELFQFSPTTISHCVLRNLKQTTHEFVTSSHTPKPVHRLRNFAATWDQKNCDHNFSKLHSVHKKT
jgi:hypothetical protein